MVICYKFDKARSEFATNIHIVNWFITFGWKFCFTYGLQVGYSAQEDENYFEIVIEKKFMSVIKTFSTVYEKSSMSSNKTISSVYEIKSSTSCDKKLTTAFDISMVSENITMGFKYRSENKPDTENNPIETLVVKLYIYGNSKKCFRLQNEIVYFDIGKHISINVKPLETLKIYKLYGLQGIMRYIILKCVYKFNAHTYYIFDRGRIYFRFGDSLFLKATILQLFKCLGYDLEIDFILFT